MKKVGIVKRLFCLLLIFLLSINSFAAIVSDNDGSAFITKAEFDALKSSFQSQIDTYNQSIDSKIDGAIASYLAGIKLSTQNEKKILIGDSYKMVGYYDDKDLVKYIYPYTGMDFAYTYLNCNQATGNVSAATLTNGQVFKAKRAAIEGIEPTVIRNINGQQSWVWNGLYTGVKEIITSVGSGTAAFSEGLYWAKKDVWCIRGPILNDELNDIGMNWTNDKNLWKFEAYWKNTDGNETWWDYKQTTTPQGMFKDVNHTLSMQYSNKTQGNFKNGKLDCYIIAYKHSTDAVNMCVNYSNSENSFSPGKIGDNIYTATAQAWWDGVTIDQKTIGMYHAVNHADNDILNGSITKHATLNTDPKKMTDWDTTKYMPVVGGVGELTGNQIRQELDNLTDSTIGNSITLSNLTLSAGLPVCIEKVDNVINWKVSFVDKTKKYKVWLSYSPFDTATDYGNPDNASNYVKITNNTTTNKYITINNGVGDIDWVMEKTSPVYCKWCIDDNGVDKCGGQLDLSVSGSYTQIMPG